MSEEETRRMDAIETLDATVERVGVLSVNNEALQMRLDGAEDRLTFVEDAIRFLVSQEALVLPVPRVREVIESWIGEKTNYRGFKDDWPNAEGTLGKVTYANKDSFYMTPWGFFEA